MGNLHGKSPQFPAWPANPGQSPRMTCQFPFRGLRKKSLTVKGSGCVASGHPAYVRQHWLLEEDDRSKAGGGFGAASALLLSQPLAQTTSGCLSQ